MKLRRLLELLQVLAMLTARTAASTQGEEEDNPLANMFHQGGCLYQKLAAWNQLRVCNSNDYKRNYPGGPLAAGICRPSNATDFNQYYTELRIATLNWESTIWEAWLLQILLSELLGVPVTTETGYPDQVNDFYDPLARMDYGTSEAFDGLFIHERVHGNCRIVQQENEQNNATYQSCSHFSPELWQIDIPEYTRALHEGLLEFPQALGILGHTTWYVPKITAQRYPEVLNYFGLRGEQNRRKLAETFLRPTTWKEYCDQVSPTHCVGGTSNNTDTEGYPTVATRPPKDDTEFDRFFVPGLYNGHFRQTPENDCDIHPETCKGFFLDYPCGWTSYFEQQSYHLNISLEGSRQVFSDGGEGGLSFSQILEIWYASNATKSDLIALWWSPDIYQTSFRGSDIEMVKIALPTPLPECDANRAGAPVQCSANFSDRVGSPLGSCDREPQLVRKIASRALYEADHGPFVPEAMQSPTYDCLQFFQITTMQLEDLFAYVLAAPSPRDGVCQWAVENLDYLKSFIPKTYPRVLEQDTQQNSPLRIASVMIAAIAVLMVLVTFLLVYRCRERRVMVVAQVEFLYILLTGLLLIAIGSVLDALPSPTNATCVAATWLVNCGYTVELIPLIVKVFAINRLTSAARRMRRVTLTRRSLYGHALLMLAVVVAFLSAWVVLDPPIRMPEYELLIQEEDTLTNGETVIKVRYYCSSGSTVLYTLAIAWNAFLLLVATILAFQMRQIQSDFNESATLAIMIYSHFFFVVLRLVVFFLSSQVSNTTLSRFTSLIYSVDTVVTIIIYFIPKFFVTDEEMRRSSVVRSTRFAPFSGRGLSVGFGRNSSIEDNNSQDISAFPSSTNAKKEAIAGGGDDDSKDTNGDIADISQAPEDVVCSICKRRDEQLAETAPFIAKEVASESIEP